MAYERFIRGRCRSCGFEMSVSCESRGRVEGSLLWCPHCRTVEGVPYSEKGPEGTTWVPPPCKQCGRPREEWDEAERCWRCGAPVKFKRWICWD